MNTVLEPSTVPPAVIVYRVKLAGLPQFASFMPASNRIGTVLLRLVMEHALRARLREPFTSAVAFELNRAVGLVSVAAGERNAALAVVSEQLLAASLLDGTEIYWQDLAEGIWRNHPAGLRGPDLPLEALANQALMDEFLADMEQRQADLRRAMDSPQG